MSVLITSVLNCASDRLAISLLLHCIFSGSLICSFIWAMFFCLTCLLHSKGWSLRCSPGWGNPRGCVVMLYVGKGSEREQWYLLCSIPAFSHFPHYPQANWALLVLIPGWVCVRSRTLWVSPSNSPVRLGVSPAASAPADVFSQMFEALFPRWDPGL